MYVDIVTGNYNYYRTGFCQFAFKFNINSRLFCCCKILIYSCLTAFKIIDGANAGRPLFTIYLYSSTDYYFRDAICKLILNFMIYLFIAGVRHMVYAMRGYDHR